MLLLNYLAIPTRGLTPHRLARIVREATVISAAMLLLNYLALAPGCCSV